MLGLAPPSGSVKINVDGSATANPGEIAIGGVCRDHTGAWCFGFTMHLGFGTNFCNFLGYVTSLGAWISTGID